MKLVELVKTNIENIIRPYIPKLNMHDMDKAVKRQGKKNLVGLEIGVNRGFHAYNMLHNLPIKKLYLVDPYLLDDLYGDGESRKQIAYNYLKKYHDKIEFIYETSEDAVDLIPDNSLDFLYDDGDHRFKFIKKDIELYQSKVKVGGLFGGEDFSVRELGVCRAVLEFIEENDIELHCGKSTDWWVIKE